MRPAVSLAIAERQSAHGPAIRLKALAGWLATRLSRSPKATNRFRQHLGVDTYVGATLALVHVRFTIIVFSILM
jgi:hypothetical protein